MGTRIRIRNSEDFEQTIGIAWNDYKTEKEAKNLAEKTLKSYEETLGIFLRDNDLDLDTPVAELTDKVIFQWVKILKDRDVKPSSINHYLRDMRTFLNWLMDRRMIKPFTVQLLKGQEESLKFFTDREVELLLKKPRKYDSFRDWRSWCIVNWVIATGNRAATVCEIKIGDIDFQYKEITLRHTKNKKLQIIPLSPTLEAAVREYMKLWRYGVPDDYYLFPNIGEEKMSYNALRLSFEKYCEKREVAHANFHGLRHSFARLYCKNGGNVFTLQKLLGHSSLEQSRKYIKMFADDIKEDYELHSPLDNMKRNSKRTQAVKRSL